METTNNEVKTQNDVWVPISQITVPEDARVHTQEDIDSRAVSMTRDGQEQPILLSKEGEKLVLVYGNGRLESAKKLGWDKIRADIKEGLTETQKMLLIFSENNEREHVSPFFTARVLQKIMELERLSSEQLPDYLKKSRTTVYDFLALGKLPREVQAMSERSDIGFCHLREIAKVPTTEHQVQLAQECAEKDYSVRELQARVKQMLEPKEGEAKPNAKSKAKQPWTSSEPYPFEFTRKGSRFAILGQAIEEYEVDLYVQQFRMALGHFLDQQKEAQMPHAA